jgi:hypothetical protein
MCRVSAFIAPPGIFFGQSTATLADFQTLPASVALPLCSSYSMLQAKKPTPALVRPKRQARPGGLVFTSSADGVTFKDEDFVREVQSKLEQLKRAAASPDASSCNAVLARKALKYRKLAS